MKESFIIHIMPCIELYDSYLDIVEDVDALIIIDGSISSNPLCKEIVSSSVWDLDKYSGVVKVAEVGFL